jgi:hypothetical protein
VVWVCGEKEKRSVLRLRKSVLGMAKERRQRRDELGSLGAEISCTPCTNVRENLQSVTDVKWRIQNEWTGCKKAKIIGAG